MYFFILSLCTFQILLSYNMSTEEELLERIAKLEHENELLRQSKDVIKCKGVTGKGTPCRNKAAPDAEFCRLHHGRGSSSNKNITKERTNKSKKITRVHPKHNHLIGEVPHVPCELCGSHGDVFDPSIFKITYETITVKRSWCDDDDDSLPELIM